LTKPKSIARASTGEMVERRALPITEIPEIKNVSGAKKKKRRPKRALRVTDP
jgi:hypothetical protein